MGPAGVLGLGALSSAMGRGLAGRDWVVCGNTGTPPPSAREKLVRSAPRPAPRPLCSGSALAPCAPPLTRTDVQQPGPAKAQHLSHQAGGTRFRCVVIKCKVDPVTSFLKGSIKAIIEGNLLTRSTYRSTSSAAFLCVPSITSYFPLLWQVQGQ